MSVLQRSPICVCLVTSSRKCQAEMMHPLSKHCPRALSATVWELFLPQPHSLSLICKCFLDLFRCRRRFLCSVVSFFIYLFCCHKSFSSSGSLPHAFSLRCSLPAAHDDTDDGNNRISYDKTNTFTFLGDYASTKCILMVNQKTSVLIQKP